MNDMKLRSSCFEMQCSLNLFIHFQQSYCTDSDLILRIKNEIMLFCNTLAVSKLRLLSGYQFYVEDKCLEEIFVKKMLKLSELWIQHISVVCYTPRDTGALY